MNTIIKKVDYINPENDEDIFLKAALIIKNGGLVAFPTETVYGLGANALDPVAVKKIYEAKGRPSDNPLIVHISEISQIYPLVKNISEKAEKLMKVFWPGPITMVFNKTDLIPAETSGGLSTVAIRFPENKTARYFIKKTGLPIAAPSANSSGKPSPTRANHVKLDLNSKIDMIIDGGYSEFGLESTIIDVSGENPCLLRPGSITKEMIEDTIGKISVDKAVSMKLENGEKPKAPGMKYTHYSPLANVTIISGEPKNVISKINSLINENIEKGSKVGVIATKQTKDKYICDNIIVIGDKNNLKEIASNLFMSLRRCDQLGLSQVYTEAFNETGIGMAIMNRLKKAAGYNIINV